MGGGVTEGHISRVEKTDAHPSLFHLVAACEAFNVNSHSLLIGTGTTTVKSSKPPNTPATIGSRVREFRCFRKMSQEEFADELDAPLGAILNIELDRVDLLYSTVFFMESRMNVDVEWLLFGNNRRGVPLLKVKTDHIPKTFHSLYPITPHGPSMHYTGFPNTRLAPYMNRPDERPAARPPAYTPAQLRDQYAKHGSIAAIAKAEGITVSGVSHRFKAAGIDLLKLKQQHNLEQVVRNYKIYRSVREWSEQTGLTPNGIRDQIKRAGLSVAQLKARYGEKANPSLTRPKRQKQKIKASKPKRPSRLQSDNLFNHLDDYAVLRALVQSGGHSQGASALGVTPKTLRERLKAMGIETISRIRNTRIPEMLDADRAALFDFAPYGHGLRHRIVKHRLLHKGVKFAHIHENALMVSKGEKRSKKVADQIAAVFETTAEQVWPEIYGSKILSEPELIALADNLLLQAGQFELLRSNQQFGTDYTNITADRMVLCRIESEPRTTLVQRLSEERSIPYQEMRSAILDTALEAIRGVEQKHLSGHPVTNMPA